MKIRSRAGTSCDGSAIVLVALLVVGLAGVAASLAALTGSGYIENRTTREHLHSFHLCEAGLNEAWATLRVRGEEELVSGFAEPVDFGPDTIDVDVTLGSADATLLSDRIWITARARVGHTPVASTLVVRKEPNGDFRHALFGSTGVVIESNAYVDSYDSAAGPYDPDAHGDLADVGSNEDIELHANIEIYGSVYPGPDGVIDDSAPQTLVTGVMQPAVELVEFEELEVPEFPADRRTTIRSTSTIGPGDFHYLGLTVDGGATLRIVGPARVVLDEFVLRSNASVQVNATAGPVELHCTGNVQFSSNSSFDSQSASPRDVLLHIVRDEGDNDSEVTLASNSEFHGTIYAPNVDLVINSNFEIFGGVRAGSIELESNARIHFDEKLLFDADKEIEYSIVSWSPATPSGK